MTTQRTLTSRERQTINALYAARNPAPRIALRQKAAEYGITFETAARAITTEAWSPYTRICVKCSARFQEWRPPFIEPRAVVCSDCMAEMCPNVRVSATARPQMAANGRRAFDLPCARECGRRIRGLLTRMNNPVPKVCAYCVADDVNASIREEASDVRV